MLLPFQPYDVLPQVLASGDVLLALLEPDAGVFSVPSKVLTYLCAGRPILAAIPSANLAARTITRAEAGVVVAPGDETAFVRAGIRLLADSATRAELGANGRRYAERVFDLERITSSFEAVLERAVTSAPNP
jgi:glycosyltransferase involved in cell wall biosynthesis